MDVGDADVEAQPVDVLGDAGERPVRRPVSYTHLDVYKRQELGRASGEGRIDQSVECQRGGVGDDGHHVVDADLALAAREQSELADLMARGEAVAPEQGYERGPRFCRDGQACVAHLGVDEAHEIALTVSVARKRYGVLCPLAQRAQRRSATQIAGLDHHAAVRRGGSDEGFDCRREVAAAALDPHGALAAEQRNGVGLLDQACRLRGKVVAVEPRQLKGVLGVVDGDANQRLSALVYEARIRSEHEHDRPRRIRPRQELVDVAGFQRDHRCAPLPSSVIAAGCFDRPMSAFAVAAASRNEKQGGYGMIKLSVLYPAGDNAKFDMDYYCKSHMPMVKQKLGAACKGIAVEQGMAGGAPGAAPTYVAMGHVYFDSVAEFQTAFTPHAAEIMGDIPNYTSIQPVIQISEVKM